MTEARLHEPDKLVSAIQAAILLAMAVAPLAIALEFRRTVIPVSLSVPIVAPPTPPLPASDAASLRQEIAAQQKQSAEAEIARQRDEKKRKEEELEKQRLEAEAERKRNEEAEAERKRVEEQRLKEEQERKRLEEERLQEEQEQREQEERERVKEQRLKEEQERRRKLEAARAAAEAQRLAEQAAAEAASLSPAMRASLLGRYIAGIKERVYRHMSNPEGVDSGIAVEIRVRLNDDGTLARLPEVADGSGNAAYDTQAVRAVIRAAEGGFDLPDDSELRSEFGDLLLIITPKN